MNFSEIQQFTLPGDFGTACTSKRTLSNIQKTKIYIASDCTFRGDGVIIVQVLSATSTPISYFVCSLFHIFSFSREIAIDNFRLSNPFIIRIARLYNQDHFLCHNLLCHQLQLLYVEPFSSLIFLFQYQFHSYYHHLLQSIS